VLFVRCACAAQANLSRAAAHVEPHVRLLGEARQPLDLLAAELDYTGTSFGCNTIKVQAW